MKPIHFSRPLKCAYTLSERVKNDIENLQHGHFRSQVSRGSTKTRIMLFYPWIGKVLWVHKVLGSPVSARAVFSLSVLSSILLICHFPIKSFYPLVDNEHISTMVYTHHELCYSVRGSIDLESGACERDQSFALRDARHSFPTFNSTLSSMWDSISLQSSATGIGMKVPYADSRP